VETEKTIKSNKASRAGQYSKVNSKLKPTKFHIKIPNNDENNGKI
jgi:hypothetical protein